MDRLTCWVCVVIYPSGGSLSLRASRDRPRLNEDWKRIGQFGIDKIFGVIEPVGAGRAKAQLGQHP